jgi:carbonic anhydrase
MIACCDSRVSPDTIFGAPPGEVFTVRNIANLIPPMEDAGGLHGTSAALEYAVLHLKVGDS